MEVEQWRTIYEFPDYVISSYGRVYSTKSEIFLKLHRPTLDRYFWVALCDNGIPFNRYVHRLVAQAFVPGEAYGLVVNHIDSDKSNNCDWNLEWVSQGDNIRHAVEFGHMGKSVRIVETGEIFKSLTICAKSINGSAQNISHCLSGRRRSHKGYTFEWVN